MKQRALRATGLITAAFLIGISSAAMAQKPACTLPTAMAPTPQQTAWQLFVAANCPTSGKLGPLTWENWTEQSCWQSTTPPPGCPAAGSLTAVASRRFLHGSNLRARISPSVTGAAVSPSNPLTGNCGAMTTVTTGSPLNPFVPGNLAKNPTFCEEVFVDPSESAFVIAPPPPPPGSTLKNLTGQLAYGAAHNPLTFPTPAVEVKADWLPATSLNPAFNCTTNPPAGVFVETIAGQCYALVALHFSSKLAPNWLWATFEPQNKTTNPNRCNPNLYVGCNDPWGSNPASSTGANTAATPALLALMSQAGLPPVFQNYRLVGTETTFVNGQNQPIQLGNSFTEFNAGVKPHEASCITCHHYASVAKTSPPKSGPCCGTVHIGTPPPLPSNLMAVDFSWMLPGMPPAPAKK